MSSLKNDFDELLTRLKTGRDLNYAGFEPIYYLVFPPRDILTVKRQLPAWKTRLRDQGWEVTVFSIAENILDIHRTAPLRKLWISADAKNPLEWRKTNESLANAVNSGALQQRLEDKLPELQDNPNALILVTDLEALHPYLRIGAIESSLHGRFTVPTVFLYPGTRTGMTKLRFLQFYPDDGNYRSVHIGG